MWPLIVCVFASLAVLFERAMWWWNLRNSAHPDLCEKIFKALTDGAFKEALELASGNEDPHIRTIYAGLNNADSSMLGAMQMHASNELEQARKKQWILNTFITMAPLLGLIGTVIGIMDSFNFVGNDELAVTKVSGGIAEALIATATGLGIAIVCLLPYNFFNKCIFSYRLQLEHTMNRIELIVESAKTRGHDLSAYISKHN